MWTSSSYRGEWNADVTESAAPNAVAALAITANHVALGEKMTFVEMRQFENGTLILTTS